MSQNRQIDLSDFLPISVEEVRNKVTALVADTTFHDKSGNLVTGKAYTIDIGIIRIVMWSIVGGNLTGGSYTIVDGWKDNFSQDNWNNAHGQISVLNNQTNSAQHAEANYFYTLNPSDDNIVIESRKIDDSGAGSTDIDDNDEAFSHIFVMVAAVRKGVEIL